MRRGRPPRPDDRQEELDPRWMTDRRQIVIDTGSLLATGSAHAIVGGLVPHLRASEGKLFVLDSTVTAILEGLRLFDGRPSNPMHVQAVEVLSALERANAWVRVGDPQSTVQSGPENTATLIIDLVMTFQLTHAFCVVTQNESLARRLMQNATNPAIKGVQGVSVAYIEDGKFRHWVPRLMRRDGMIDAEPELEKRVAKAHRIIVDTSSLMHLTPARDAAAGLKFFHDKLVPELLTQGTKMVVPQRVLNELEKHATGPEDRRAIAIDALNFLNSERTDPAISIARDTFELASPDATFADPVIVRAVRFQRDLDICFVTQDRNLAIMLLDNHDPSSGKDYQVLFVNSDGRFLWNWEAKLARQADKAEPGSH